MRRKARNAAIALVAALAIAVPAFALAVGDVEVVLDLPVGQHPEGIAFDKEGNLFFGNRTETLTGFASELVKIAPGKEPVTIATFATAPWGTSALLGLATDDAGDVWAAMYGGPDHGVWRVSGNGNNKTWIPGSDDIHFPNALTFDAQGNLYVTDSGPVAGTVGGAIWRLARGGSSFELWSDDEALAPVQEPAGAPPSTFPGANGIAFYPPDSLYVANTEKSTLLRFEIRADGSAGPAELLSSVPFPDGIAVDQHGDIHVALPGHAVLPIILGLPIRFPPLVVVDADTGTWTGTTSAAFDDLFDVPLSVAFDTRPGRRSHLYATNGDLAIAPIPIGQGPRLVRADVGVKGYFPK